MTYRRRRTALALGIVLPFVLAGQALAQTGARPATAETQGKAKPMVGFQAEVPYILQYGEYPACIADRFNIDVQQLLDYNNFGQDQIFNPATLIKLPPDSKPYALKRAWIKHPATYHANRGETFFSIACQYGDVKPEDIASANGYPNPFVENTTFNKNGVELKIP